MDSSSPANRNHRRSPRRRAAWIGGGLAVVLGLSVGAAALLRDGGPVAATNGTITAAKAASYDDVYSHLRSQWPRDGGGFLDWLFGGRTVEGDSLARADAALPGGAAGAETSDEAGQGTTSQGGTNVQVEGIDEGDMVKTDGANLYIAKQADAAQVQVVAAKGAESKLLATIDLQKELGNGDQLQVLDLMIKDKTLAVLVESFTAEKATRHLTDDAMAGPARNETQVVLYNISDPAKPEVKDQFGQSGAYQTSRLDGHVLYLVTNHFVEREGTKKSDPATFVPLLRHGDQVNPVPAQRIELPSTAQGSMFMVVTALDIATGKRLGDTSVLGAAETVYMSHNNLYLATTRWDDVPTDGGPGLAEDKALTSSHTKTDLVRLALNGGALGQPVTATIDGRLVNQFALDEYQGHLRAALTLDNPTRGAVSVMDQDFKQIGLLDNLGPQESVQSVRFAGVVGYVVTFRQTDPLFALDLSDPAHPRQASELKLPGFSSYLHPFGDNRLAGFGFDGDERGTNGRLKLSLFDTTDPFAVKEVGSTPLPFQDSEAAYNHHAFWANQELGLVGFPAWRWDEANQKDNFTYQLYRLDDAGQFGPAASLPLGQDYWGGFARAVQLGGELYVATSDQVEVLDLPGLTKLASVEL